jgi:predicted regulator of Ras-like GTPase activity (Roadblock/LC7/MglB family)
MKTPAPADLQRWSEELARNPASLAFLPLARSYRRLGRRDLATRLCLRGLEAHPANVEAHALLALLYLEGGDRARAADEWSVVLRLKPGNFEALRGMGFRYLEQNETVKARQHLERAALIRPADTTVQEALRLLRQRETALRSGDRPPAPTAAPTAADTPAAVGAGRSGDAASEGPAGETDIGVPELEIVDIDELGMDVGDQPALESAGAEPDTNDLVNGVGADEEDITELVLDEPWAMEQQDPTGSAAPTPAPESTLERAPPERRSPDRPETSAVGAERPRDAQSQARPSMAADEDPNRLFEELVRSGPVLGALLLDPRGLVLAGSISEHTGARADDIGAILGAAVDEASRTVAYLELGNWTGLLMESEAAVIHVVPVSREGLVVLAAKPDAPTGWILRASAQAATIAARYLEVPA